MLPHSWLITEFVTRVTRRVRLGRKELPTFPEHPSSHLVFSGVHVARSLVYCVEVCRLLSVYLSFFFGHSSIYGFWLPLVSSIYGFWLPLVSSIYGFWLPLWCLQTFLHMLIDLSKHLFNNKKRSSRYVSIFIAIKKVLVIFTSLLVCFIHPLVLIVQLFIT